MLGLALLLALVGNSAAAQTQDQAETLFSSFQQDLSEGKADMESYDKLLSAYKQYEEGARKINTDNITAADRANVNGLRNIYPYMRDGAYFCSENGSQDKALEFAYAYISIPKMSIFSNERFSRESDYPTICFFAASTAFNSKRYADAVQCFDAYIETEEEKNREQAFTGKAKAYAFLNDPTNQLKSTEELVKLYPNNPDILSLIYKAINTCIATKNNGEMEKLVEAALRINPGDPNVLPLKGKLLIDKRAYEEALPLYEQLLHRSPKDFNFRKTYAQLCYNHAAKLINEANNMEDRKMYREQRQVANESLKIAQKYFEELLDEHPKDIPILSGLADTYRCLGKESSANSLISRIELQGGKYVASNIIDLGTGAQQKDQDSGTKLVASAGKVKKIALRQTSSFLDFAKDGIITDINQWEKPKEYESDTEYLSRVNDQNRQKKLQELGEEYKKRYIAQYQDRINLDNMRLGNYDANNGTFCITSPYIDTLLVAVPRANNEADEFKKGWNKIRVDSAVYCVANDRLALSELSFIMGNGRKYVYHISDSLTYQNTRIINNRDSVDFALLLQDNRGKSQRIVNRQLDTRKSDVDTDIPLTSASNPLTYVLIIANEDYRQSGCEDVPFAVNDGRAFRDYCIRVLGCPQDNIHYEENLTAGMMSRSLQWIDNLADANPGQGQARFIFYYAGHGLHDEATKSPYLLPVDVDANNATNHALNLSNLLNQLGRLPARQVTVFLDACFSGMGRNGKMLVSGTRGVATRPKQAEPKGNMLVFSATSDTQVAQPYSDKKHGLFTYFLLKGLKEKGGNVRLGELVEYVTDKVRNRTVNKKYQSPTYSVSSSLSQDWHDWTLGVDEESSAEQ